MTREIDPDAIESGSLTFAEAEYLRVRGKLPKDYEMPDPDEGDLPPDPPETMEDVEIQSYPIETRKTPLEDQDSPSIGNRGGIVDDDDEEDDYSNENGWNNDSRRAELSKRGLSVDGNKEALIARLRRSDADMLEEGDEV